MTEAFFCRLLGALYEIDDLVRRAIALVLDGYDTVRRRRS